VSAAVSVAAHAGSRSTALVARLSQWPAPGVLALVVLLAGLGHFAAWGWLDAAYAASRFPVPYAEAQLSFDAAALKGWFAELERMGTMPLFEHTQRIDYVFMASTLLFHASALLLIARLFPDDHAGRGWMVGLALASALAPLADALENAVSFVMLADPAGFADVLALPYSAFAALKFTVFTATYAVALFGLVAGLLVRWRLRTMAA